MSCRSHPNTLDCFLDEYKDTVAYCDHYKADMGEKHITTCAHGQSVPLYFQVYPMKECKICGVYTSTNSLTFDDDELICGECSRKQW